MQRDRQAGVALMHYRESRLCARWNMGIGETITDIRQSQLAEPEITTEPLPPTKNNESAKLP